MKPTALIKIATSSMLVGAILIGSGIAVQHVATASVAANKQAERQAATLFKATQASLKKGKASDAVASAEKMVKLAPEVSSYRQLLGEAYLAAGRFQSAETTLNDSLELSPGNEQVALKLALVTAALGKPMLAQNLLNEYRAKIAPTDMGLAMALAGDASAAIPILESVVRSPSADARARQNLALVYAMSGRWLEARTVAAQDLSPDLLDRRITEWAGFVRPKDSWDQVASLLNVKPAYDPGQPVALALAPRSDGVALAFAAPTEEVGEPQVAAAYDDPAPAYQPPAAAEIEPTPFYETAPKRVVRPRVAEVPLVRSPKTPMKSAVSSGKPAAKASIAKPARLAKTESGNFAVQLAAVNNSRAATAAWLSATSANPALGRRKPTRTIVTVNNKQFYRIAVAGLATRAEAAALCQSIKASGGNCFVRSSTAATPTYQYAARKPVKSGAKLAAKPATVKVAFRDTKPVTKPVIGSKPAQKVAVKMAVKVVAKVTAQPAKPAPKTVAKAPAQTAKPTGKALAPQIKIAAR